MEAITGGILTAHTFLLHRQVVGLFNKYRIWWRESAKEVWSQRPSQTVNSRVEQQLYGYCSSEDSRVKLHSSLFVFDSPDQLKRWLNCVGEWLTVSNMIKGKASDRDLVRLQMDGHIHIGGCSHHDTLLDSKWCFSLMGSLLSGRSGLFHLLYNPVWSFLMTIKTTWALMHQ